MGVLAGLGIVGGGLILGGAAASMGGAGRRRNELQSYMDKFQPNIAQYQSDYFSDLDKYSGDASRLSSQFNTAKMQDALRLREMALPGIGQMTGDAQRSISPLLRGELPPGVMDAFTRAGGASTVGMGMGGSGFGALNTGMFGARGALGGMQTGMGLLGQLLGTMPQISMSTPDSLLQSIKTPAQRAQTQLQVRGQNLGIASQVGGMERGSEIMGGAMGQIGGLLLGGAMGGGMGMGGGGKGGGGDGANYGNFTYSPPYQGQIDNAMGSAYGRLWGN